MLRTLFLITFIFTTLLCSQNLNKKQEQLHNEIIDEFGHDFKIWDVKFNKNSLLIRFSKRDSLFARGQSKISALFSIVLEDFYPRYINILSNHKDIIKALVIKGHTSSENDMGKTKDEKYELNRILSQERSDNVLQYILNLSDPIILKNKDWIKSIVKTIGVSSSEPIFNQDDKEDKLLSRRIEFIISFNEDKITKDITANSNEAKKFTVDQNITKNETNSNHLETNIKDEVDKKVITLYHYVKKLLVENPSLNEQYQLLNSIKQDIEIAKTAFNPTVTLNYSNKKYNTYDDGTGIDKTYDRSNDITIRYNIFNGFKDSVEKKITKYNYLTTKYTKDQIENELIFSLVEAFLTIQKTNEYYELSRENYGDYIKWTQKEELRFQNGLISLKDFAKIQARGISRFMNFEEDTKRYLDSITTMQKYINFDDKDIEYFEQLDPISEYFDNPILALEDSKELSPYAKEANQNVKLYKAKLEKSKVNFYPTIDLIGKQSTLKEHFNVTSSTITDEKSIALEAKIQLYSGGKEQADYEKKLFEYRQKIQKRDSVIRDVIYKVDLSFNAYGLNMVKNDFLKDLVSKREEEYIASNYDYKFAKIDANGLLDVVDSLYNAKRQYIENRYDMILAKYKVLSQIGVIKNNILE